MIGALESTATSPDTAVLKSETTLLLQAGRAMGLVMEMVIVVGDGDGNGVGYR